MWVRFWFHHSNIDRVWWQWQMLDPATRAAGASAVAGPYSLNDEYEPHRNGTIEDVITLDFAAPGSPKLGDLLSTTSGPFCYVYE